MTVNIEELTLEITHDCPYSCIHCSSRQVKGQLTLEQVMRYLEKYNPKVIRWSGGEPFIYLNKDWLLDGYRHIVTTCGAFPDRVVSLSSYFDEIRISIYGNKIFHEAITGVKGSFNRACKLAANLHDSGYNIVLTSPHWNHIQTMDVIELASRTGTGHRIAALVPSVTEDKITEGNTCSTGHIDCKYGKKILILPNGKVVHCAVEKRGLECPWIKKEVK